MLFSSKLVPKLSLSPEMTFVARLSLKQNYFTKPLLCNQASSSIIDSSNNILVTATSLDKDTDTNMINVNSNKFYDYLAYFLIPIDVCPV